MSEFSVYLIQFVFFLGQLFFPQEARFVEDIVSDVVVESKVLGTLNVAGTESFEEVVIFSQEWAADKEEATVSRVIDGDTIELADGRKVRYVAIDTPESVDPRKTVECFGTEATKANEILVLGKQVWLEKDVTDTDRYGRLLRYVYTVNPENQQILFVNKELVAQGFASAYLYEPDTYYYALFKELEHTASLEEKGFWAPEACK